MSESIVTIKASDLQRIGVSKPYAHQLIAGGRTPSLKLAMQIETEFGVPPSAWPLRSSNHDSPPSEGSTVDASSGHGAVNPDANISRTEVAS